MSASFSSCNEEVGAWRGRDLLTGFATGFGRVLEVVVTFVTEEGWAMIFSFPDFEMAVTFRRAPVKVKDTFGILVGVLRV